MQYKLMPVWILAFSIYFAPMAGAQTTSDAIMMKQGEFCLGLIYDHGAFGQYWEGTHLRENGTIATVHRNSGVAMIAAGVFNKLNLIVGMPYVSTHSSEPNGGKFAGVQGLQDLTLALKYEFLNRQVGKGKLAVLSNLGFTTPVSNYLSDYRPYSLGSGAPEVNLRAIVQYQLDNGFYARTALAYLWRGQTEAERDYYYNNGSYYTAWMDVPSAWNYHVVLGKWMLDYRLRTEVSFAGINSISGDDIRPYTAPQPTNKVVENMVGAFAQYYFKKPKGFGLLAYYNQVVQGRNTGKSGIFGLGLTYQFHL